MDFLNYIIDEALIMIPALYIIGEVIRQTTVMLNKFIPLTLLIISIIATPVVLGGYTPDNIVQAVLIVGVTVFGDQLIKQTKKGEYQNGKNR